MTAIGKYGHSQLTFMLNSWHWDPR